MDCDTYPLIVVWLKHLDSREVIPKICEDVTVLKTLKVIRQDDDGSLIVKTFKPETWNWGAGCTTPRFYHKLRSDGGVETQNIDMYNCIFDKNGKTVR